MKCDFERQFLVSFVKQHDFDDPKIHDSGSMKNDSEFRGSNGPEAGQRTAPGYAHGQ